LEVAMSELTPDDETLLEQARHGLEPEPAGVARVKKRVFAQIGAAAAALTTASSATGTATTAVVTGGGMLLATVKILVAVVLVGGMTAGGVVLARRSTSTPGATQSPAPEVAPPPPSSLVVEERLPPAPAVVAVASGSATEPGAAVPEPAHTSSRTAPTVATPSTLSAEADLLRQAGDALRGGNPASALVMLDQHAGSYPHGVLSEERDAERIIVLCALGRTHEAHDLGAAFLTSHPRSPLAGRVRASCGGS
jgi:hypothetical protein